jgi:hypothetical protein
MNNSLIKNESIVIIAHEKLLKLPEVIPLALGCAHNACKKSLKKNKMVGKRNK